ncbi:uncharacterized protein LOC144653123 isoform X3 [Oculina patagonica]
MNETGSRPSTGMTSPRHPSHQAVMDRLRQRFSQYRKHHYDCQNKYVQSLPAVQDIERQEALNLHKRALDSRNRMMNMNGKASKQNDGEGKVEQQQPTPNVLDKSTNAIFQIREQQILLKKRKHEQNMSSSQNSYVPSNDDNLGGECVKFQRQDGGVLLQAPSTEGPNAVVSVNQPNQFDHTSTQVHQPSFRMANNSFIHDGSINASRISTTVGSETYANEAQGLLSSFAPSDFKQEKPVIGSCDEPTHSNNGTGAVVNGLPAGEEYIRQELIHFENVIKRFNEDSAPVPPQPIHHQTVTDRALMPSVDDNRNQVPETPLGGHHPQSLQLKEIARKSQLAQAQQVMPYMDSQDRSNPQFSRQHATQYALGPAGQQSSGMQHPYSTGKGMSMISNDQQQMLQDPNHHRQFESPKYQRALSSQSQLQQQQKQQQQQQPFYGFPQDSLPSSKLTHMPSQVQQLYSQRFSSQPVLSTSQGAGLVRPMPSHELARYPMPRSQAQYQRQSSMPPLQGQAFVNSDSQFQQQVGGFQGDQPGFSNPVDPTSTYHYQRRNSFPIYYRGNSQPLENFSRGMQHNLGSSQANLLRGVLQNPSQNMPGDRDTFLVNPTMVLPSSTTVQTAPLLTGRPPSANGELNSGVPRSHNSSIMYRGNVPHQQQSTSVLQQASAFPTSNNARKITPESSYSDSSGTSAPTAGSDAHFSAYSPLNALDKAPSFTSLLEQSAINQGNLETTYTGSIPNLDLLGELLENAVHYLWYCSL